ncbi:MAG TPA: hypothetical protein VNJ01_09835 [Bacteriovoracaceae bacterium]|nr:hypothetical protein [Bacteriovoracaceae bacterium]
MKNDKKSVEKKPYLYNDHKAPVTRREFLATGAIGMSTLAFTSGLSALLSPSNVFGQALTCGGKNLLCGNIPFLCIDGAGGMNIAGGNAIVGFASSEYQEDFGTTLLSDYRRLGIHDNYHPTKSGMVNNIYGLKFHSTSGILEGLDDVLAPREGEADLRQSVDGLILCALTADDTGGNPLNTAYMAQKAGAIGDLVQLIGNVSTVSGGSSVAPSDQVNLVLKPSYLTDFRSSESLLSIGDSIVGPKFLNSTGPNGSSRLKSFMNIIQSAGQGRLNELKSNPTRAAEVDLYLSKQSAAQNVFDRFSPAQLNPIKNTSDADVIKDVYDKMLLSNLTGGEENSANILNLLTKRIAGAATITVGGCDYHNGTASAGHATDKQIGQYIGYAIRMAAKRNVPIFIHLFTDGGVVGDAAGQVDPNMPTRTVWRSDSGERSAALMFVFKPGKIRVSSGQKGENSNFLLANKTRQIGFFKQGGGVVLDANSLANNSQKLWMGVILNYMATQVHSTDDAEIVRIVGEQFRVKFGSLPNDWQKFIRLKSLVA